jgi:hypothetical protein
MNLPINWKQKLFAVIGFVMFFFGLWQMDLITVNPVWNTSWTSPIGGYFSQSFEFGRIGSISFVTTIGTAYDLCQAFMVAGLIIVFLALWLWND